MRGQREKECLNTIIMSVFYDQNKKLIKDLKGKAYSEVSEEQFLQDYLFYTNVSYENGQHKTNRAVKFNEA